MKLQMHNIVTGNNITGPTNVEKTCSGSQSLVSLYSRTHPALPYTV